MRRLSRQSFKKRTTCESPTLVDTSILISNRFLLARLQLNIISQQVNVAGVRAELANLPAELEETYRKTLERIQSQGKPDYLLAERLLYWVTFAFCPLTIEALQTAMAIDPDDDKFDQDKVTPKSTLVSSCAGLIAVDPKTQHVYLFRESIKLQIPSQPDNFLLQMKQHMPFCSIISLGHASMRK
jgi:hypothetical protein